MVAWLSSSELVSINVVTLRRARGANRVATRTNFATRAAT